MKVVLFDTNFFYVKLHGRDLFEEIAIILDDAVQLITLDKCIAELGKFAKGKTKEAAGAKLALTLIKIKNFQVKTASGKADNAILQYALLNPGVIVATNDVILRKRLREQEVQVLTLKGVTRLELV